MAAHATARWEGGIRSGAGTFTAGDTISGEYSFRSRFEDGPGANPEQLIGAAHAACFSMALSSILEQAGHVPTSITTIELATTGVVDGIDAATFEDHARTAKEGCPVSRALAGVPEVTLTATLEGAGA